MPTAADRAWYAIQGSSPGKGLVIFHRTSCGTATRMAPANACQRVTYRRHDSPAYDPNLAYLPMGFVLRDICTGPARCVGGRPGGAGDGHHHLTRPHYGSTPLEIATRCKARCAFKATDELLRCRELRMKLIDGRDGSCLPSAALCCWCWIVPSQVLLGTCCQGLELQERIQRES